MQQIFRRKIPFYIHISYLFVAFLIGFALVNGWNQFQSINNILKQQADQQFRLAEQATVAEITGIYQSGAQQTKLLAQHPLTQATSLEQRLQSLGFLTTNLQFNPALVTQYLRYQNGDYFGVRHYTGSPLVQQRYSPPAGTVWIVESLANPLSKQSADAEQNAGQKAAHNSQPIAELIFFNDQLQQLERRADATRTFDLHDTAFSIASSKLKVTEPYLFITSGLAGISFVQQSSLQASRIQQNSEEQSSEQQAVVGSDMRLARINEYLLRHKITHDTRLVLLDQQQQVLASHQGTPALVTTSNGNKGLPTLTDFDAPVLKALIELPRTNSSNTISFELANGEMWEGLAVDIQAPQMPSLKLLMATPHHELLATAIAERNHSLQLSLFIVALGLFAAIWLARKASNPINALTAEIHKLEQFQFDEPVKVDTNISEIARLASNLGSMKTTIHRFMELSQALAAETNFGRLLARILDELGSVVQAEGGAIFVTHSDGAQLASEQYFWHGKAQPASPLLFAINGNHVIAKALQAEQVLQTISPTELQTAFPWFPAVTKQYNQLTLPLRNREGTLIGALALLIDSSRIPSTDLLAFVKTIAATAAVAVDTQRLIKEQKVLLEAFIQLIAGAIDAKSPYTGGHCQRVPELTKMLAHAAEQQQSGPFADYSLNEDQWEALHIAAWLHDCGKITTPEYVVDKATKLETIYDRIHEVRMRFEVLKRDAEIRYWQDVATDGVSTERQQQLKQELSILDEEFIFIASCNEGGEFMAPELVARLQQIGARTWQRTLSDRIGISHEEQLRKARTAEPSLPTTEPLLADKAEHILTRTERDKLPPDNPWQFRVDVPEHLYNRGELYNLAVARGTLSAEERYKINEHIIQTIIMLEKLPFPRHLTAVPEIAGGHHEKMNGTGYPKRLTQQQMSVPARMMAIADIFEALTAVDRPYKKGKTLSEAIKIMGFMLKDQHIDPELFSLFLSEGLHLEYAKRFMRPEQIDEVDISQYLIKN
jgi:HD-GYP domain-containing protein (c-di-GMP phosphodiesterase class II)